MNLVLMDMYLKEDICRKCNKRCLLDCSQDVIMGSFNKRYLPRIYRIYVCPYCDDIYVED